MRWLTQIVNDERPKRPLDKIDFGILAAGVSLFSILTLATITKFSVWFDEAFGAYLIRFDFAQVTAYTAADVHPPLYYWLLKVWGIMFGTTELGLRSMSLFFGAIALIFGYLTLRRLFNRRAALFGLLFMVLSPMFVRYGQEMRMYTMVAAIVMAATYTLIIATETNKRKHWIIYGALVSLGMWTHYFAALAWLAHWAWRAWTVTRAKKTGFLRLFFTKNWLIAHAIAVGLFGPWIPSLIQQLLIVQGAGFWIPPTTPATLPNFFTNVLYFQDQDTVSPWMTFVFIVLTIAFIILAVRTYRSLKQAEQTSFMLIASLAFVPIALLFLSSMPPLRPSFIDRYLIPASVALMMLVGICLAYATKVKKRRLPVAITILSVLVLSFGIFNVYQLGNYNKNERGSNDTRQAVKLAQAEGSEGEPIIGDSPWIYYEAAFYDSKEHPVYFIDETTDYIYGSLVMLQQNDMGKIKDLDIFTQQHETVWYISRSRENNVTPPRANWTPIKKLTTNDPVNGRPLYQVIHYRTN